MLGRVLAVLIMLLLGMLLAYLSFTISWGMEVKNWGAFLGFTAAQILLVTLGEALKESK